MTTGRQSQVFQQLRQAVLARDGAGLTDAELMALFVGRRDGAALEALIRRHGSMVWSVCRRVLSNEQDAEDAFQASFLVFVRKAASIRARQQVGNWLYGVAYRTALKARTTDARRRAKERRAAEMLQPQAEADAGWSDLLPLLDQELSRLPDKYRTAIVLCELEGRPRKEAARQLGIPEGTLSSRLATGRRMLAKRLGRPGLALSAGALATAAAVPPALMASTVKASLLVAAGMAAAGVVSVRVAALAEGVVKAMFLSKLSIGAALLVAAGVLAAGVGGAAYCAAAADPKPQPQTPPVAAVPAKGEIVDKEGVKEEEPEWGKAVNGVQVRLRMSKLPGGAPGSRDFALDVRNQGEVEDIAQCRLPNFCEVEWDGQWYKYGGGGKPNCDVYPVPPRKEHPNWLRSWLDAPWERLPDRKVGDPPSIGSVRMKRLTVEPGKHTVRVAFVFNDNTRPVSQLVEYEEGKESAWGEAVDGVQARIRTLKVVWKADEQPSFLLDLRNQGKRTPHGLRISSDAEIELDGTWYLYGESVDVRAPNTPLPPGQQIDPWVKVAADELWVNGSPGPVRGPKDHLSLPPGKHTVRLAFKLTDEKLIRPISGPIEVEIVKRNESAWGESVDGIQARIRTPKLVWGPKEAPTFSLDLRNQGKKTPDQRRMPYDCQIEVDKVWYSYDKPSGPYVSVGEKLEPGAQVNNWTTVTPDGQWTSLTAEKKRFPLPPGKHTIRIAYQLQGTTPAIRPVSGPLEIEISEKAADGAKGPPNGGAAPPADNDKQTPARRAVDIRKKLSETIDYELAVDTTLDKALDELLTSHSGIPWTVNDTVFGPDNKDIVKKTPVEKIDPITGVTVATVLNRLLAKIPNDGGKMTPMYLIRPDRLEIITRDAYLRESYPNRNPLVPPPSYLPPPAYAVFDKVPLSEALAELANTTGGNVVVAGYAAKEAETKVTAELNGVPLDAAVTLLADMADLKCARLGNVYYVTTRKRARELEAEEQKRLSKEKKQYSDDEPAPPTKAAPKQ